MGAASPEDDPCRSGLVGRIRAQGPECFDACPQMCEPLAEAFTAFFRRGGAPALRRVICRHKESFYCPLLQVNQAKCEPFDQGPENAYRFAEQHPCLPGAVPELEAGCLEANAQAVASQLLFLYSFENRS